MGDEFEKFLSACDVSQKLGVPAKFLGGQYAGGEELMVRDNQTEKMYRFVLSIRKEGLYKKPVFIREWIKFSRDQQLQAGQKIYFWRNDDEDFYRIQVLRDFLGAGLQ